MGDHKSSHAQELQAMFCVFHALQNQSLEPPYTFWLHVMSNTLQLLWNM